MGWDTWELVFMGLWKNTKFFLLRTLLPTPIYFFLRLYVPTLRVVVEDSEEFEGHLREGGRMLLAGWHERLFGWFCYPRFEELSPCLMVSQSRDGDVIADLIRRMGGYPVRGSSTRRGERGLRGMISGMATRKAGLHLVDGPQGPARIIKPGLVALAQKAKAAICPVYVSFERPWVFHSWDRLMIPKPFSRVLVRMGPLEWVPFEMDDAQFEQVRRDIEEKMITGYEEADRYWAQKRTNRGGG